MTIIHGMPNADYHARPEISKTGLDLIDMGPSAFQWAKVAPQDSTKAFDIGHAGHAIICEPDVWASEYIEGLDIPRRKKEDQQAHEDFEEAHKDKYILDAKDYRMVETMRDSIMADPTARMIIESANGFEVSIFNEDPETGVGQRCRLDIDCLGRGIIADLKFIDKIEQFKNHIHDFRYHVQDAHYTSVTKEETNLNDISFLFIVCAKTRSAGRHPVMVWELDDEAKQRGAELRAKNMATYAECLKSGNWISISKIGLPRWAR